MTFTDDELDRIYARTGGDCHLCGGRLARSNYGRMGRRGAWEVDHSKAQAAGGSHHGNNLFPAHISCNRSKQANSSRAVRQQNGLQCAPPSTARRKRVRAQNTAAGGLIGAGFGYILGGPVVALLLGTMGLVAGHESDPAKS